MLFYLIRVWYDKGVISGFSFFLTYFKYYVDCLLRLFHFFSSVWPIIGLWVLTGLLLKGSKDQKNWGMYWSGVRKFLGYCVCTVASVCFVRDSFRMRKVGFTTLFLLAGPVFEKWYRRDEKCLWYFFQYRQGRRSSPPCHF